MKKADLSQYPMDAEFWSDAIDRYVVGFRAERNREILKYALIHGMTYEQIAEKIGMSVSQIKRVVYKAQEQLFLHF